MLTGLCSHISQLVAFDAGATDYLIKPFVPEELVSKVEKLLCRASVSKRTTKIQYKTFPAAQKVLAGLSVGE